MKGRVVVGVDEAGRGPLAGPVAVGVAVVPADFDWRLLSGVTDSKQLSPKKRGQLYGQAKQLRKDGEINFAVSMVGARVIDKKGIVTAVRLAMARSLKRLRIDPEMAFVRLDGGLKAPEQYTQETIIKGDQKEKVIGLASICAKETRDRYMERRANDSIYAAYGFDQHKGYGTRAHRHAIQKNGLTREHRKSFCQNCLR